MIDPEIQKYIQDEARKIAEDVYNTKGTQYGVAQSPLHVHNNIDLPSLPASSLQPYGIVPSGKDGVASRNKLLGQTISTGSQAANPAQQGVLSTPVLYTDTIPIIFGIEKTTSYTMTGTPVAGATSATLNAAYPNETNTRIVGFTYAGPNTEYHWVKFTKGSTSIVWGNGLANNTITNIAAIYTASSGGISQGGSGAPGFFQGGKATPGTVLIFIGISTGTVQLWVRSIIRPNFTDRTVALTGTPAAGATTATLSSNWTSPTNTYPIFFPNGEFRFATLTNGGNAVNWVGDPTAFLGGLASSAGGASLFVSGQAWVGFNYNALQL